jgi:hypothetical protein
MNGHSDVVIMMSQECFYILNIVIIDKSSMATCSFFVDAKGSIREIILPKGLDLDRPKRTRTSFTAEQLYRLEMEFQRCQYVVGRERTELARQLNLSETQVNSSNTIHVPISLWPSVNKYQIHILCYHRYVMGHSTNRVPFG